LSGIRAASCRRITSAKNYEKKNKTLMKQKLIAKENFCQCQIATVKKYDCNKNMYIVAKKSNENKEQEKNRYLT
jgi:hypothetical protein